MGIQINQIIAIVVLIVALANFVRIMRLGVSEKIK